MSERDYGVDAVSSANIQNYSLITQKIVESLCSEGPFQDVLHEVLSRVVDYFGACRAIVLTTKDPEILYTMGDSADETAIWLSTPYGRFPEVAEAVAGREPLFLTDEEHEEDGGIFEQRQISALAVIPMVWDREAFGVFEVWFERGERMHAFAQDSLHLIGTVLGHRMHGSDLYRVMKEQTNLTRVTLPEEDPGLPVLQKYREFFQRASDGVIVLDTDSSVMHINPTGEAITGYSRRGLVGSQLSTIIEQRDRQVLASRLDDACRSDAAQTFELNLITTSQDTILISVSTSAVLSDEGVLVLSFKDITEERRLEDELRSTKEFLEHLIDSTVDGIVVAGHHDGVILFNKGGERIFGAEAQEVVGRRLITDLFPEGEVDKIKALMTSSDHGGEGRLEAVQTEVLNSRHERMAVSLSASQLYVKEEPAGMVLLINDLTERLAMEERLALAQEKLMETEQQAMLADLAGATAHELNQPLTSIMGYAELLKRRLDEDDENLPAVETILREADRLADIVRKIDQIIRFETRAYNAPGVQVLDLDKSG